MAIRAAVLNDLPAIREIYNAAVIERVATCDLEPRSEEDRLAWFHQFNHTHYPIFVSEEGGQVIGYSCLSAISPKAGYRFTAENSVYIAPAFRGHGHGQALLRHLIDEASKRGIHYLLARIFPHNAASLSLHDELGFDRIGVQREVANLDGKWTDVVLLEKILSSPLSP